tara:strand:+ start:1548 stop:1886 length:339 start_codon:yes stop_codon:yes gene_type:complete
MNPKIKEYIIAALLVVICVLVYLLSGKDTQIANNDIEHDRLIDSIGIDLRYYKQVDSVHRGFIDSMSIIIEEKPKYRTVYINNHKGENEKIANLDSLTRTEYLDSIFTNSRK